MAKSQHIEIFQDLVVWSKDDGSPNIREVLIGGASSGWRHSEERETEISEHAGPGFKMIVFEHDASDEIEAVALFMTERSRGVYEVTNIVPRDVSELGSRGYNLALENFIESVVKPTAETGAIEFETSSPLQSLDDWLPEDAATALQRFSGLANKSTGSAHPSDRKRWFEFLLAVHHDCGSFNTDRLIRWLIEIENWSDDKAHELAIQYEFALELLDEYDKRGA